MLGDEGTDGARHAFGLRELEPFAHVVADDGGAGVRLERVVKIAAARLVLDKVLRPGQLADIVVVRADARQHRVGPDRAAGRLGQIGDRDRVGVGPRRLEAQPLQQWPVQIAPLEQRQVCLAPRPTLGERQDEHGRDHAHHRGARTPHKRRDDRGGAAVPRQSRRQQRQRHHDGGDEHPEIRLVAPAHRPHHEGGGPTREQQYRERVRVAERRLHRDQNRSGQRDKQPEPSVEQRAHHDGDEWHRNQLHSARRDPRRHRGPQDGDSDERREQREGRRLVEHLASQLAQRGAGTANEEQVDRQRSQTLRNCARANPATERRGGEQRERRSERHGKEQAPRRRQRGFPVRGYPAAGRPLAGRAQSHR